MYPLYSYRIKFVLFFSSVSGSVTPAAFPASMDLSIQAMFLPRTRMICMPSSSFFTSSGHCPCTMFQYWEDTTGICVIIKYLFSWSRVAVVPALLAEAMAAPGLWAAALLPE